jgi:hypothetical protein
MRLVQGFVANPHDLNIGAGEPYDGRGAGDSLVRRCTRALPPRTCSVGEAPAVLSAARQVTRILRGSDAGDWLPAGAEFFGGQLGPLDSRSIARATSAGRSLRTPTLGEALDKLARYKRIACPEAITVDTLGEEARIRLDWASASRLRRASCSSVVALRTG